MEKTNKMSMKNKKDNIFYDPSLKKRHAKAKLFKYFTITSLAFSLIILAIFLSDWFWFSSLIVLLCLAKNSLLGSLEPLTLPLYTPFILAMAMPSF